MLQVALDSTTELARWTDDSALKKQETKKQKKEMHARVSLVLLRDAESSQARAKSYRSVSSL
jgi:hypothetical protein